MAQPRRGRRAAAGADRQSQFRQPEKPHAMGQFVGCLQGIGEAARALDFPIVSGNVSLYNETMGVGISADAGDRRRRPRRRRRQGGLDRLQARGRGGAADRRRARLARPLGVARDDSADATRARRRRSILPPSGATANSSLALIRAGRVERRPRYLRRRPRRRAGRNGDRGRGRRRRSTPGAVAGAAHAFLFGEDQGRYVVTARPEDVAALFADAQAAGVPAARLGTTGGDALTLPRRAGDRGRKARRGVRIVVPAYMDGASSDWVRAKCVWSEPAPSSRAQRSRPAAPSLATAIPPSRRILATTADLMAIALEPR